MQLLNIINYNQLKNKNYDFPGYKIKKIKIQQRFKTNGYGNKTIS